MDRMAKYFTAAQVLYQNSVECTKLEADFQNALKFTSDSEEYKQRLAEVWDAVFTTLQGPGNRPHWSTIAGLDRSELGWRPAPGQLRSEHLRRGAVAFLEKQFYHVMKEAVQKQVDRIQLGPRPDDAGGFSLTDSGSHS